MISYEKKCIFVHIPKTGGASIEKIIWPKRRDRVVGNLWKGYVKPYYNKYQTGGMQHLLARHIMAEVGQETFEKFLKFTIVRNPWDKAVSQYAYLKKRKDLRDFVGMSENADFKTYLSLTKQKKHVQWESQHRFICDDNGRQLVDYVGRFENFEADVNHILRVLEIGHSKIPHRNKSDRTHYQDYYDAESAEMVGEMYREDAEIFGYTFQANGKCSRTS